MKISILFIISIFCYNIQLRAQIQNKIEIDNALIENWKEVNGAEISPDGLYSFYSVSYGNKESYFLKSVDNSWEIELNNIRTSYFSGNGKYLIYEATSDSIFFFNLKNKHIDFSTRGSQLKKVGSKVPNTFSWTERDNERQNLLIWDLTSNKHIIYKDIVSYYYSSNGNVLTTVERVNQRYILKWISLSSQESKVIWTGTTNPKSIVYNATNSKVAFFTTSIGVASKPIIRLVVVDDAGNKVEINNGKKGLDSDYFIQDRSLSFNNLGTVIFFSVVKIRDTISRSINPEYASVDVWHFRDRLLQSEQLSAANETKISLALFNLNEDKGTVLELDDDENYGFNFQSGVCDVADYAIIRKRLQVPSDIQFSPVADESKSAVFLLNVTDFSRTTAFDGKYATDIHISPGGKFLVYYDVLERHYFSYEIKTHIVRNITNKISVPIYSKRTTDESGPLSFPSGNGGWLEGDRYVYIYDNYDVWQVDPYCKSNPINITNGYGRENKVELRFQNFAENDNPDRQDVLRLGQTIIVKALAEMDYKVGFLHVKLSSKITFKDFDLRPFQFGTLKRIGRFYLVLRSSSNQANNWYLSTDLKKFHPLTFNRPEENYLWPSKELIAYKNLDGTFSKGILYKPANFDSTRKYPVIFQFYEIQSNHIYEFERPKLSSGSIRPLWESSRGYLVFLPDIIYKFGNTGESAVNSVLGAAKYLSKFPYVDSTKMGLSGGSHGGFAINYIITRTNIFAAAAPTCGIVDLVSGYGGIRETGFSTQYVYETSQNRVGSTLWQNPELFISGSSIFRADKVTTPVLIMHNKEDDGVPWSQGLEWYMALRRLGKKVWMLQYDGEKHGLRGELNQKDYTKRLDQFFDHYLKGNAPPFWMTRGIPAKLKQIDSGLEIDSLMPIIR